MNLKKNLIAVVVVMTLTVAAGAESLRTLSVTGVGRVQAIPNVAVVTLSFVSQGAPDVAHGDLLAQVGQKAEPALAAVKALVGNQGSVRATAPVVAAVVKNQQKDGEWQQVTVGKTATRQIEVTLRGEGAIAAKLAKLYDNPAIKPDAVSDVSYGFAPRREAALQRQALQKAYANALDRAKAQLEPGEKLGKAIARGTQAAVPAPRARAMALAAAAPESFGGSAPTIESGNLERSASTNVVFEVKGKPKRK